MSKIKWWGYLHTSGTIQVKRYFGPLDIQEAHASPFCKKVFGPFDVDNREEVLAKIKEKVGE